MFYIKYAIAFIVFMPFSEIKGHYLIFLSAKIVYLSA
jgi:hypothetical protein